MVSKEISEEMKLISRRLKEARLRKGLTQLNLALQSGISQNMIASIERGTRNPAFQTVILLCRALDLRLSDLLQDIEPAARTDDTERRAAIKAKIEEHTNSIKSLVEEL